MPIGICLDQFKKTIDEMYSRYDGKRRFFSSNYIEHCERPIKIVINFSEQQFNAAEKKGLYNFFNLKSFVPEVHREAMQ
jgi:hypothetical protein